MDLLHPAIVHFPIGLLSFYVLLETISVLSILKPKLFTAKLLLLGFGTVGAYTARLTGEHDAAYFTQITPTLALHSQFSAYVVIFFGILTMSYVLEVIPKSKKAKPSQMLKVTTNTYLRIILALIGFGTITIVGALGGAMVHGPDADPMIRFVTDILGLR